MLVYQNIKDLIKYKNIRSIAPIEDSQIQPNSLDLRICNYGYEISSTFSTFDCNVIEKISEFKIKKVTVDDILIKNHIYIFPLLEVLKLENHIEAKANPKSTTGRLDIFTRVLSNYSFKYDYIKRGYNGNIYLEIIPRSFNIKLNGFDRLCQLRFILMGTETVDDTFLETSIIKNNIVDNYKDINIDNGLYMSLDLSDNIKGYKAIQTDKVIDTSKINYYNPKDFFQPIFNDKLIIEPEEFYIFKSKERLNIPFNMCAEMIDIDTSLGEFRSHYAGFFDSGFGQDRGANAVLEVRPHGVPILIEDNLPMFRMEFYENEVPDKIYGIDSNYQHQELRLAKQFKQ